MKTNIKIVLNSYWESVRVQEIVFANGGYWGDLIKEIKPLAHLIIIDENKKMSYSPMRSHFDTINKEIVDADLFIETNGTCNINDIKYVNWKLKGTEEKPLRIPIAKETEELNKQIDNLCLKNSFWDKEKIEYNTDETPQYYGEVNLKLSNNATNPNHYTKMKIAPNEYITANYECFSWNTANVIKYTSRYKSKNGIEDLEKAIKYLQFEIEELRKTEQ